MDRTRRGFLIFGLIILGAVGAIGIHVGTNFLIQNPIVRTEEVVTVVTTTPGPTVPPQIVEVEVTRLVVVTATPKPAEESSVGSTSSGEEDDIPGYVWLIALAVMLVVFRAVFWSD